MRNKNSALGFVLRGRTNEEKRGGILPEGKRGTK